MIDQDWPTKSVRCWPKTNPRNRPARAIGYAEMIEHVEGRMTSRRRRKNQGQHPQARKAQRTWFKTFRRVRWLDIERSRRIFSEAITDLAARSSPHQKGWWIMQTRGTFNMP
jgi:tRNA A37 N6-isopentenylltransferase MiaA